MRPPPHPLVLAAVLGAATGAIAAWFLEGTQQSEAAKPATHQLTSSSNNAPRHEAVQAEKSPISSSTWKSASTIMATTALPQPSAGDAAVAMNREPLDASKATIESKAGSPTPLHSASVDANTELERAFSAILWDKAADAVDADKSCLTGNPIACLELADHEDSIQAFGKSRAHRERAYAILVLQCHNREPDACMTIARMHALGLGIAHDPASERALFARAKTLCKSRQGKVCAALNH